MSAPSASRSALLALVLIGGGVLAWLFEGLFLDQCLLSFDNRQFAPYRVHRPVDTPARPMNLLTSDINGFVMPETLAQLERVREGEWPLWNPRQNLGQPLLADMGFVAPYPTTLLYLSMDPLRAYAWSMALHVLMLGLGTWVLFRRLGQDPGPALLAALALTFSGFVAMHLHIPNFLRVAAWIPWLWWAGDRLIQRPGPSRAGVLALVLGGSLLAGFPQLAFLGLYAAAAAWLTRLVAADAPRMRALGWGATGVVLGGALSAVLLLPGAELYGESWRGQGVDEARWQGKALKPPALLGWVLPMAFGSPVQQVGPQDPPRRWQEFPTFRDWLADEAPQGAADGALITGSQSEAGGQDLQNNLVENAVFVGRIPLLLALWGLLSAFGRGRRPGDRFFAVLWVVSLAVVLGVPGLAEAVRLLPGLSAGNPKRALFLTAIAMAWCAAAGWRRLREGRGGPLWLGGAALLALGALSFPPFERWLTPSASGQDQAWVREVIGPDLLGAGLAGLLLLGGAALLRSGHRAACATVLILGTGLELVGFARAVNPPIERADQWATAPAIEVMLEGGAGQDARVITFGEESVLGGSIAQVHGLRCANGISAMADAQTGQLLAALEPGIIDPRDPRLIAHLRRPQTVASPLLDLLGVRFVAANVDASGAVGGSPGLEQIHWDPREGVAVVERSTALPPMFFASEVRSLAAADDRLAALSDPAFEPGRMALVESAAHLREGPQGEARVLSQRRPGAERAEAKVAVDSAALLVFSESHYPGWEVEVDGRSAELLRVDHALMGVWVESGASEVLFEYRPASFRWGLRISVAALGLSLLLLAGGMLARLRGRP